MIRIAEVIRYLPSSTDRDEYLQPGSLLAGERLDIEELLPHDRAAAFPHERFVGTRWRDDVDELLVCIERDVAAGTERVQETVFQIQDTALGSVCVLDAEGGTDSGLTLPGRIECQANPLDVDRQVRASGLAGK